MKKNIAIPIDILRGGDQQKIAQYGPQNFTVDDLAQLNADEIAAEAYSETQYQRDRAQEYPHIGDQLDALWRGLSALATGEPLPDGTTAMREQIQSVKSKYPAPSGAEQKTTGGAA